ncbi:MAG: hypothetical protein A4S16_00875 [Proteobacteria bacterium SG_bin6]|nr:MAG: hypothetical protein A4S16_00875 [Proteobacteria bacterium SG_bin6]
MRSQEAEANFTFSLFPPHSLVPFLIRFSLGRGAAPHRVFLLSRMGVAAARPMVGGGAVDVLAGAQKAGTRASI